MTLSTQLTDLLKALIGAGNNGSSLPSGARPLLEAALVHALLDPDCLNEHIRFLQRQADPQTAHRELLDEAASEAVLDGGLVVLDDAVLARLALNPIALAGLADEIEERQPTGWAEALREAGLELLRAHGRTVPAVDELIGRESAGHR